MGEKSKISFLNGRGCSCLVAKSYPTLVTPWTLALQAPLSMRFLRQEYWSGLPFPFPEVLSDPGIKPAIFALQVHSLPLSHLGRTDGKETCMVFISLLSPYQKTLRSILGRRIPMLKPFNAHLRKLCFQKNLHFIFYSMSTKYLTWQISSE